MPSSEHGEEGLITDRSITGSEGFSIIEAIVAVGILGLVLLPILSLQRQLLDGAQRIESSLIISSMREEAEAFLRHQTWAGLRAADSVTFADFVLFWAIDQQAEWKPVQSRDGIKGRFDLSVVHLSYRIEPKTSLSASTEEMFSYRTLVWKETAPIFDSE